MKILVTGGTGVIGRGVIPALLKSGHEVRLLSRHAEADAKEWPRGPVEPFKADVTDPATLRGAAEGCEVVVHITGIVEEAPPEVTYERVNVQGTRNMLDAAGKAGVRRFVYVSSLGADTGESAYHRSKLAGEQAAREFGGEWVVLRPGNVYGPGDEVITTLLKMVRALPAVPVVGEGGQRFQPVWYEDFGEAVARACNMEGLSGRVLEVAGREVTSTNDLIERMSKLTDRKPARIPVPSFLASLGVGLAGMGSVGSKLASLLGVGLPLNEAKLTMLLEENLIREGRPNALTEVFHVEPTGLDEGLRLLADSVPEQLPDEGTGGLERKRFWADISGTAHTPQSLLKLFRERVQEIMPMEFAAEPGAARTIKRGLTLTASLPARGHIQMKVVEANERRVTLATVEGHPLAGVVQFSASREDGAVRFLVEIHARAANAIDWLAMSTVGAPMQDANWVQVVERVVGASGGQAPAGVQSESEVLDEQEAAQAEKRIQKLVTGNRRAENTLKVKAGPRAAVRQRPPAPNREEDEGGAVETLGDAARSATATAARLISSVGKAVKRDDE